MNIQRILLNDSSTFSEIKRGNVKQKMSFFAEKNPKISFMQNEKLILYDYRLKLPLLRGFLHSHQCSMNTWNFILQAFNKDI